MTLYLLKIRYSSTEIELLCVICQKSVSRITQSVLIPKLIQHKAKPSLSLSNRIHLEEPYNIVSHYNYFHSIVYKLTDHLEVFKTLYNMITFNYKSKTLSKKNNKEWEGWLQINICKSMEVSTNNIFDLRTKHMRNPMKKEKITKTNRSNTQL